MSPPHEDRSDLPEDAPKRGDVFAGKYRIEGILGLGGMGYVLAATHLQLRERVAIKLLLPDRAKQAGTVARFLREGRAAVRIRSEHVARVLDVGSHEDDPYIVMEYLDGSDLSDVLRRRKRLPIALAVDYVLQACEAIAEAHAMGTIHRDLKPANLFLVKRPDGRDCIKVLDFGISKSADTDEGDVAMTKTTSTVGTPLYMSPEQLKSSKNVDVRTDVWALGVILFELVGGRPPFRAESIAELGAKVLTTDAPDLRGFVSDAPAAFADAVRTCLRRDVRQRYASVADLAHAIASFGSADARASAERIAHVLSNVAEPTNRADLPTSLDDARRERSQGTFGESATDGTWGTATGLAGTEPTGLTPARPGRRRGVWVAAVALCVVTVGVGGGVAIGRRARRVDPTTATDSARGATPADATDALPSAKPSVLPAEVASPSPPVATPSAPPIVAGRSSAAAKALLNRPPRRGEGAANATASSVRPVVPPPSKSAQSEFMRGRFADDN
jgi:eukaryotic-like serine/threonine-protein kinase